MAEGGLVHFARVAREAAEAALPAYLSKYPKRLLPQPSLLAILCCLMRHAGWTFREAGVRLVEHREPRAALGLERVPDYTTVYRFLWRIDAEVMTPAPGAVVIAVDAAGLAPSTARRGTSTATTHIGQCYRVRSAPRLRVRSMKERRAAVGRLADAAPANASSPRRPVVDMARQTGAIGRVVANAGCDSERTHCHIRD